MHTCRRRAHAERRVLRKGPTNHLRLAADAAQIRQALPGYVICKGLTMLNIVPSFPTVALRIEAPTDTALRLGRRLKRMNPLHVNKTCTLSQYTNSRHIFE